jgi:hypothetical protein
VSGFRPLVLDGGDAKQLQSGEDVDIPANARIDRLESAVAAMILAMVDADLELPDEVTDLVEEQDSDG